MLSVLCLKFFDDFIKFPARTLAPQRMRMREEAKDWTATKFVVRRANRLR